MDVLAKDVTSSIKFEERSEVWYVLIQLQDLIIHKGPYVYGLELYSDSVSASVEAANCFYLLEKLLEY